MKIAIFTDLYLEVAGGIPSSISAQKRALKELGHEVTVFCPGRDGIDYKKKRRKQKVAKKKVLQDTDSRMDEDVVVIPTCKHLRPGGAPLAHNPEIVQQWVIDNFPMFNQFDIVHVHYEAGASIAGAKLARQYKIPLVQTMHGREDMALATNIPHPFKTIAGILLCWFQVWFLPREKIVAQDSYLANTYAKARMWTLMVNQAEYADVVLTPSMHFGKKLKHYGVDRPIYTVSNGVDDKLVARKWPVRSLREGEPLKIIWNSRVSKEKRIMPFLEAVYAAGVPIRLDIYGNGNQLKKAQHFVAKQEKKAKKRNKKLGAEAEKVGKRSGRKDGGAKMLDGAGAEVKVQFYGSVSHEKLLEKMEDQHLSATVSYGFDTQGLTLLEAEATGLPVFYCDPELGEAVLAKGGVLAKTPSVEGMAKALRELYRHPERVEEMSRAMLDERETILQSQQIQRLQKVYRALLS